MKILIEGWRNINHSYSIVNQYQILEFVKRGITVHFSDVNFFNSDWNELFNSVGLDQEKLKVINSLDSRKKNLLYDVTYRISFPYNFSKNYNSKILVVFGTSEFQDIKDYYINSKIEELVTLKNFFIHTPSQWSKEGFIKAGFEDDKLVVIPHGVDTNIFKPISYNEVLEFKKKLNIENENLIILSLGSMTYNKGIDILIKAYFELKRKYKLLKLILKDQSNLYKIKPHNIINQVLKDQLNNFKEQEIKDYLKDIIILSNNFNLNELNTLYNIADCYVSPYRGEGFNLPPLEAAACGTPIVVTKNGSTDDYFNPSMGFQIESQINYIKDKNIVLLEPNLKSLIDNLQKILTNKNNKKQLNQLDQISYIKKNFLWEKTTERLLDFFNNKINKK